jgi:hypothetical protein
MAMTLPSRRRVIWCPPSNCCSAMTG